VRVEWDTPLLGGYNHEFLPLVRDAMQGGMFGSLGPLNRGVGKRLRAGRFDAVWLHGYHYLTNLRAIRAAAGLGFRRWSALTRRSTTGRARASNSP